MASTFRNVIDFMNKVGLYDVVLPFLLVFTVVFGVLEKSKVFGTMKVDEVETTKKNLNAMVAFVVALFVVASSKLVTIITDVSSNVVLMILFSFFFLVLVGMLAFDEKGVALTGGWKTLFFVLSFVVIIIIFMAALGWLDWFATLNFWENDVFAAIVLFIILVGFMALVVGGGSKKSKK